MRDQGRRQRQADHAPGLRQPRASRGSTELDRRPDRERSSEPQQAGKAVDVDAADRQHHAGQRAKRPPGATGLGRPRLRQTPERDREGEHEQRLHRLLEGALDQVGGDEVGEADDQRAAEAPPAREQIEQRQRRQAGRDGDEQREAVERLHRARPELGQGGDDRVRTERIALGDQPLGAAGGETVDGEQVLRHVGVEPGAEDAEPSLDEERQRGEREGRQLDRDATTQRRAKSLDSLDDEVGREPPSPRRSR